MSGTVTEVLAGMQTVTLKEMDAVELINRIDTKFVFREELLPGILGEIRDRYRVLEIEDKTIHRYDSLYFDDERMSLYLNHHNGRANRYKLRIRNYGTTGVSFMEVKRKTNTGRTVKARHRTDLFKKDLDDAQRDFFRSQTGASAGDWEFSVQISFRRITLVSMDPPERLTIDLDLTFDNGKEARVLGGLVVAEVKQGGKQPSAFLMSMRERQIKPLSISKYCMAVSMLDYQVRRNLFKPTHRHLHRMQENPSIWN